MAVDLATPIARPRPRASGGYLRDLVTAVRIVAAVAIVVAGGAWPASWHHLLAIGILAVLTWPVRSVRWGTIFNLFVAGALFGFAIIAVQWLVEGVILGERFPLFRSVVIAPITEEPLKALPLVLLLMVARWPFRWGHGAVDLMLCGFALGSGFGLFEDALRGASDYPLAVSPRILGIPVFLDSYREFIGHGGTTAFVGLALGWAIWCSRRKALLALGPLLVAAVLWWMMVDHALVNFAHNASFEWPLVVRWTWTLTGGGAFAPYVLFGALLATMAAEKVAVWRATRRLPRLSARGAASLAIEPLRRGIGYGSLRAAVRRIRRLALYVLARRQIGFLMLHARGDRPSDAQPIRRLLRMRIAEVCAVQTAARQR